MATLPWWEQANVKDTAGQLKSIARGAEQESILFQLLQKVGIGGASLKASVAQYRHTDDDGKR